MADEQEAIFDSLSLLSQPESIHSCEAVNENTSEDIMASESDIDLPIIGNAKNMAYPMTNNRTVYREARGKHFFCILFNKKNY